MNYQLSILPRAAHDLQEIYSWIENASAIGARRWYVAFETAARSVLRDPASYGEAAEEVAIGKDLREFRFKTRRGRTYRAIFQIREADVCILRIRGPGQPDLTDNDL